MRAAIHTWIWPAWIPGARTIRPVALCSALVAAWIGGFAIYLRAMVNNDVAWLLTGTAKWLCGARLYDGVVEVNPPLVFYLDIPPVLAAKIAGIGSGTVFVAYAFILIGACLALITRLTSQANGAERWALPLASVAAVVVFPSGDFGQREHLMLVLSLPYVFLAVQRAIGNPVDWRLTAPIGALGALGFCLKPQFLLAPLFLEVYLLKQSRWTARRPELFCLSLVGLAYGASIPLFAPEYLTRVVPYALLVYGKGFGSPLSTVILIVICQTILLPVALLGHILSRRRQICPQYSDVFLLCAVIFYAVYVSEMKGFMYQSLPITSFLFLGLAAAVSTGGRPPLGALSMAGMLALPATMGTYSNRFAETLAPVVRDKGAGGALFVFSSYVWMGFPLTDMIAARWPSRFPSLWLLPGAERGLRSAEAKADKRLAKTYRDIEAYTVNSVVEDFAKDPPSVVIVDEHLDPRFGGIDFDYISFFTQDPRFARLWSRYDWVRRLTVEDVGPVDIYVPRSAPNGASVQLSLPASKRP